jgi:hypothetical protein
MSRLGTEFSDAEKRIIAHFGFMDLLRSDIGIHPLYRIMCEKAFMDNDQTYYAAALRRAWKAIQTNEVPRMTPAFDRLILNAIDSRLHPL